MKSLKILVFLMVIVIIGACGEKKEDNTLVVGMELQYPPFEMSTETGEAAGISVDIAKELGKELNRPVKIENIAWTGLIPSLQTGKIDIIISSMTITEERAKVVDFSKPYIRAGLSLLIAKDSEVNSFADVDKEGMVVAVKSGTTGANLAKNSLNKAQINSFDEVAACVLEVSQGKADVFIYDALTVYKNHKANAETTRINLNSIKGTEAYWGIAVKKENEELLKEVNSFIEKSRKNKKFDEIADKYLGEMKKVFEEKNIPFFFDI
jgi:polar amino acid transport system substrate-binding protein